MAAKRRGRNSGRIGWALFALAAWLVYSQFKEPAKEREQGSGEAAGEAVFSQDEGAAGGAAQPYAVAALRDDWPPLTESGEPGAAVAQAPTSNYYLVLDGSGSMRRVDCSGERSKIEVALEAVARFVQTVPAQANLGLAVFDDAGLTERVPLGTHNREAVLQSLQRVRASGGTPLRSSIELGYAKLTEQARRQLGYGDYHLVIVTDGYPDPSSEDPAGAVETLLAASPVVLHTIGFCIGEDHVLNQPGRVYYTAADSPEQLQQGLGEVLAEAPSFDLGSFENPPP